MTKKEAIAILEREVICETISSGEGCKACPYYAGCPDNGPFDDELHKAHEMALKALRTRLAQEVKHGKSID